MDVVKHMRPEVSVLLPYESRGLLGFASQHLLPAFCSWHSHGN